MAGSTWSKESRYIDTSMQQRGRMMSGVMVSRDSLRISRRLALSLAVWLFAVGWAGAQTGRLVYQSDFQSGDTSFFSSSSLTTDTNGRATLGLFDDAVVDFTYPDLPAGTYQLSFELFIFHTWDGNGTPPGCCGPDFFSVSINGSQVMNATFALVAELNQSYSTDTPLGGGPFPGGTGRSGEQVLAYGRFDNGNPIVNHRYTPMFDIDHAGGNLSVRFEGNVTQPNFVYAGFYDEAWSIDTVRVVEPCEPRYEAQGEIAVGNAPLYAVLDPVRQLIYSSGSSGSGSSRRGLLSVVDQTTQTQIDEIDLGLGFMEGIAISADGRWAYVALSQAADSTVLSAPSRLVIVDLLDREVADAVPIPGTSPFGPTGVAIHPNGARAYVTHRDDGTVHVVDLVESSPTYRQVIGIIAVGGQATDLVVLPTGDRAYVASRTPATVAVIDVQAGSPTENTVVDQINPQIGPNLSLAFVETDALGERVYVAYLQDSRISVIDTATNQVQTVISTSSGLADIAVADDERVLLVAGNSSGTLIVIDLDSSSDTYLTQIDEVAVGEGPFSATPSSRQDILGYVVNSGSDSLTVVGSETQACGPDLVPTMVSTELVGEWQSLQVEGSVVATVENQGNYIAEGPFEVVFFEDRNFNGTYERSVDRIFDQRDAPTLLPGESISAYGSVDGAVLFRDNLIYVFVDSRAEVAELDESNNLASTGASCASVFDARILDPIVERQVLRGFEVVSTPIVVPLTDDNGDGLIDQRDTPDILVPRYQVGLDQFDGGPVAAVDGQAGQLLFETDAAHHVRVLSEIAAADVDNDGIVEIVAPLHNQERIVLFEHDGSVKWVSEVATLGGRGDAGGAISIANLDGAGLPEIVIGANVFAAEDGAHLGDGFSLTGRRAFNLYTTASAVADIDLDGTPELIAGPSAVTWNGSSLVVDWVRTDIPDGFVGVANFDEDPEGEIVVVSGGQIYLLNHDGTDAETWVGGSGSAAIPGGGEGGPPTIADYDGDGMPEIGVAGQTRYAVFENDGTLKWDRPTIDASSRVTGSTPFDFDGDGRVEVVYRDEQQLFIYDGETGEVLFSRALRSGTATELPTVVDVDADGNAEILVTSGDVDAQPTLDDTGIYVFGSLSDSWVATRKIWNQHGYSITNVNDDGTVPSYPEPNWQFPPSAPFNSFRQNVLTGGDVFASADATASFLTLACDGGSQIAKARIGNAGAVNVYAGLPVSFYDNDPRAGGTLLGTTRTSFAIPPGLFEDVILLLPPGFDCTRELWVSVDDLGGLVGTENECREDNNLHSAQFQLTIDSFDDVTPAFEASYSGTTFNRASDQLLFLTRTENTASLIVRPPVVQVFERIEEPTQTLANADGLLETSDPYLVIAAGLPGEPQLTPGATTRDRLVLFGNPEREKVRFTSAWRALGNRAPSFTSFPATTAVIGAPYFYQARATDPEGDPLNYALTVAPDGLRVDPNTGILSWNQDADPTGPTEADIGSHAISLVATDSGGLQASQQFTIQVVPSTVNRPPVITSVPVTSIPDGSSYEYQIQAIDPDGDSLAYNVLSGPQNLAVDENGLVSWEFTLPGEYSIRLRVEDGRGGITEQAYALGVGSVPSNPNAPRLFGTPGTVAVVGSQYIFVPTANDPDGDTMTFTAPISPSGLVIDSATGRITWVPSLAQIGPANVQLVVSDGGGGEASLSWTIDVFETQPNRPPVIETQPPLGGTVNEAYHYQVVASDPDGDAVSYELVSAPAGMQIDSVNGLVTWTPGATGDYLVAIRANDPSGLFGAQVFTPSILPLNEPPVITSSPALEATVGGTYRYGVVAVDPNGDPLTFSLIDRPSGMSVSPQSGVITWIPEIEQEGSVLVGVAVVDDRGGSDTQTFTVVAAADTQPPTVVITASQDPAFIGIPVEVCVQASDDAAVTERMLAIDNAEQALSLQGCVTVTPPQTGLLEVSATASDASGNSANAVRNLTVADPANSAQPFIQLVSPEPGSTLLEPTQIVATILDDEPGLLEWRVKIAPAGTNNYRCIGGCCASPCNGEGVGTVQDGVVAALDTTLMNNGTYRIRIEAEDPFTFREINTTLSVAGNLKLGNYEFFVTDLAIPVAGIPLAISRAYNTLDTSEQDFGAGWRLALPGNVLDSAQEQPVEAFTGNTTVFVTRPDGKRVSFQFDPEPLTVGGPFTQIVLGFTPRFRAETGEYGQLDAGSDLLFFSGGQFFDFADPYNPSRYTYTTPEGVRYTIDEELGLQRVEDANGNAIDVTPDGVVSSTGVMLSFLRDSQGRIERVIEPDDPDDSDPPGEIRYVYDEQGNLVHFFDQENNRTVYSYTDADHPHYLTQIEDPLGRATTKTVYDDDGRLIGQCGPDGDIATLENCVRFDTDVDLKSQTVTDARGYQTNLILDEWGSIIRETRCEDLQATQCQLTVREYDANHNLISQTDSAGFRTELEWDSSGNITTVRSAGDPVTEWRMSYNGCNEIATERDPGGNVTTYDYDDQCNLTTTMDPLGGETRFEYNSRGQLVSMTDAIGKIWTFTYDSFGFPQTSTNPLQEVARTTYNTVGELVQAEDRNEDVISFTYGRAHRVLTETWGPDAVRIIEYTYNDSGKLTSATDAETAITLDYWNTGLLRSVRSSVVGGPELTVQYGIEADGVLQPGYDGNGNLTHVTDSLGGATTYYYDGLNRGVSVAHQGTGIQEKSVRITYDSANRVELIERFGDLAQQAPVARSVLEYAMQKHPFRVSAVRHSQMSGAIPIEEIEYVRDDRGGITEMTDAEGVHTYVHDALGRLRVATHPPSQPDEAYDYDAFGNRTTSHLSTTYVYSEDLGEGGDELRTDDQNSYQYDRMGNLVVKENLATSEQMIFEYDHRGRLVRVEMFDGNGQLENFRQYRYDPLNRRYSVGDNSGETLFMFDGANPIAAMDPDGQVNWRGFFGRPADSVIALDRNGEVRWLLTDQTRTARTLLDATGNVVQQYVYDSFGRLIGEDSPEELAPFTFNSREFDPETGLGYFRARYYDPETGRFLSPDPLFPYNYAFAFNAPLHNTDPTGRSVLSEYSCVAEAATDKAKILEPKIEAISSVYEAIGHVVASSTPENVDGVLDGVDKMLEKLFDYEFDDIKTLAKGYNCGGHEITFDPPGRRSYTRPRFALPDKGWRPGGRRPPYHSGTPFHLW